MAMRQLVLKQSQVLLHTNKNNATLLSSQHLRKSFQSVPQHRSTIAMRHHQAMVAVRTFSTTDNNENKQKPKVDQKEEVESRFASMLSKLRGYTDNIRTYAESAGGTNETWEDGFRELLGLNKRKQETKPEPVKEESANVKEAELVWYEATDPQTQKVYYYNDNGETRWKEEVEASGEDKNMKIHGKMESFYERKLASLVARIGELEVAREEAMSSSNMPLFKKLNQEVRDIRKEIETIGKQMSSTAMVEVEQAKTVWERLAEGVKDTKLGEQIKKIAESEVVKKAKETAEDAREVWETSQNPWVYRAHTAYDTVFAETEFGKALKMVRSYDPEFTPEAFIRECEEETMPRFINAFLQEDKSTLREMCGNTAYTFASAHIEQRQKDRKKKYPKILGLDHVQLYNFSVIDKVGPVAVVTLLAHQVDVEYDYEGNIVKGDENRIEGVPYFFAMAYQTPDLDLTSPDDAADAKPKPERKSASPDKAKWIVMEFAPSTGTAMLA